MKVIHIATNAFGGAGRSAFRLHEGLRRIGVDSQMLTYRDTGGLPGVHELEDSPALADRACRWMRRKTQVWRSRPIKHAPQPPFEQFSLETSHSGPELARHLPPDALVNLHWVAGFVDHRTFFAQMSGRPMVWTLHDMHPFTGGCHFDNRCGRFSQNCGHCPQLGSDRDDDLSREIWHHKKRVFKKFGPHGLHLVSPSRWLAEEAGKSSLLGDRPCSLIPYGLDTDVFAPADKSAARARLGLPEDARILLFVAESLNNPRKGIGHFLEALRHLSSIDNLFLLSVGANPPPIPGGLKSLHLGPISDDRKLADVYGAADLFVISSLADNLPNTILEALSCGTPVVGFASGGIPDLVEPLQTGLTVKTADPVALAHAIERMLTDHPLRKHCSATGRARILRDHTLEIQARRYLELYTAIAAPSSPPRA